MRWCQSKGLLFGRAHCCYQTVKYLHTFMCAILYFTYLYRYLHYLEMVKNKLTWPTRFGCAFVGNKLRLKVGEPFRKCKSDKSCVSWRFTGKQIVYLYTSSRGRMDFKTWEVAPWGYFKVIKNSCSKSKLCVSFIMMWTIIIIVCEQ